MQDDKYWKKLEYLPIAAAIERLTGNSESQEILKQSIISGCINGQIKYRIMGGLPSDILSSFLPVTMSKSDFIDNDGIEINRISFEKWSDQMDDASSVLQPCLDENHPHHALELKIAIEAWLDLFSNPSQGISVKRGYRDFIQNWLSQNHPELSNNARGRITTVINPNPKGGSPKIL